MADAVAGKFATGVMVLSASTLGYWALAGGSAFPGALSASGADSGLALGARLATDVLVSACPCALGLATPIVVLVATSSCAAAAL